MIDELNVEDVGTAWFGDTVSMRWVLINMIEETEDVERNARSAEECACRGWVARLESAISPTEPS